MRFNHLLLILSVFVLFMGCSREMKVVGDGPSVHDQLTSRGYITPPVDSLTPADSTRMLRDTLR